MPGEIENRISHQLAGTVISDITSAIGLEYLSAKGLQPAGRDEQMFATGVPAQRIDVGVLEQQECVRYVPSLPLCHLELLKLHCALIGDGTELFNMA